MSQEKTKRAFDAYRAPWSLQPIHPEAASYEGDKDPMTLQDGLRSWDDGSATGGAVSEAPNVGTAPPERRLWVVMSQDVRHAPEHCPFGSAREAGAVKHSNLTGGEDAYAGGELVLLDEHTLLLNGCSGRYRLRSEAEMRAVAGAFRASGYRVWSMGWNRDTDRPALFGTQDPEWIAA